MKKNENVLPSLVFKLHVMLLQVKIYADSVNIDAEGIPSLNKNPTLYKVSFSGASAKAAAETISNKIDKKITCDSEKYYLLIKNSDFKKKFFYGNVDERLEKLVCLKYEVNLLKLVNLLQKKIQIKAPKFKFANFGRVFARWLIVEDKNTLCLIVTVLGEMQANLVRSKLKQLFPDACCEPVHTSWYNNRCITDFSITEHQIVSLKMDNPDCVKSVLQNLKKVTLLAYKPRESSNTSAHTTLSLPMGEVKNTSVIVEMPSLLAVIISGISALLKFMGVITMPLWLTYGVTAVAGVALLALISFGVYHGYKMIKSKNTINNPHGKFFNNHNPNTIIVKDKIPSCSRVVYRKA